MEDTTSNPHQSRIDEKKTYPMRESDQRSKIQRGVDIRASDGNDPDGGNDRMKKESPA
jgi:hypothetical protein